MRYSASRGHPKRGAALLAVVTATATACTTRTVDPDQLRSTLAMELPAGTPHDRAAAVLAAHRIPHSAYDPDRRVIRGALRKTETGFLYTRDILVRLDFDTTGRLAERSVEVVTEGP